MLITPSPAQLKLVCGNHCNAFFMNLRSFEFPIQQYIRTIGHIHADQKHCKMLEIALGRARAHTHTHTHTPTHKARGGTLANKTFSLSRYVDNTVGTRYNTIQDDIACKQYCNDYVRILIRPYIPSRRSVFRSHWLAMSICFEAFAENWPSFNGTARYNNHV